MPLFDLAIYAPSRKPGITSETMHTYFSSAVDILSQGALTNGYAVLDFSLKVPKPEAFQARKRSRTQ